MNLTVYRLTVIFKMKNNFDNLWALLDQSSQENFENTIIVEIYFNNNGVTPAVQVTVRDMSHNCVGTVVITQDSVRLSTHYHKGVKRSTEIVATVLSDILNQRELFDALKERAEKRLEQLEALPFTAETLIERQKCADAIANYDKYITLINVLDIWYGRH